MQLTGFHHLTAVSADIRANHRFYTRVLGMRLVKRSVNQDDVSAYHLFYADAVGSPGTDLTFFDWPVARERRGPRSITRTHLRVNGAAALDWWAGHLREHDVAVDDVVERDGRLTLDFEDPEGQRLSLVDDGGMGEAHPWEASPVPAEYQIRGLGPVTMSVPRLEPTERVLLDVLGMEKVNEYPVPGADANTTHVYAMAAGGPAAELHVAVEPDLLPARMGAGGVHHVAFRTPDEGTYQAWVERLRTLRVPSSGPVDRFYFRSLYFREPNGILFEIATDGPGFDSDEPLESLGEKLALPPFLEPKRAQIEARLKPL
ncbi:MAG: ring-cleaving dioxygenase [Hyphomicrobiales bacterium]